MEVIQTAIEGVVIIEPRLFNDARGYFSNLSHNGISTDWSAPYISCKTMKARAVTAYCAVFNFQKPPYAQSKLVRVIKGAVLDVAVDIRKGSPTFGQHVAVELTEENHRQFFIPRGFAHGFSVLTPEVIFQYKCDNFYAPQSEGALAWDDPDLGINWRIPSDKILLSEKDKRHPRLKDAEWLFDYSEDLYQ